MCAFSQQHFLVTVLENWANDHGKKLLFWMLLIQTLALGPAIMILSFQCFPITASRKII
jgi:TRAP-type C4-dicarboxylate transport system permease small subunit